MTLTAEVYLDGERTFAQAKVPLAGIWEPNFDKFSSNFNEFIFETRSMIQGLYEERDRRQSLTA